MKSSTPMPNARSLRVLIAEDDPEQQAWLCESLAMLQPTWHVVAVTGDVASTLRAIDEQAPDLLLLDIHLPGAAGAEWIDGLDADLNIVFVTGDPEFAVHAFERAAIDYALKPLTLKRLKTAFERVLQSPKIGSNQGAPAAEVGQAPSEVDRLNWLTVSRGNDVLVVPVDEILYLQADLKYTRVISLRGEGLARIGISELSDRLPSARFARIHRGAVVNMSYISSVKRNELGQMDVRLNGRDELLRVSKSFQHVFRAL